jgi:hypothetical protein
MRVFIHPAYACLVNKEKPRTKTLTHSSVSLSTKIIEREVNWRYGYRHSLPEQWREASGQLHTIAALSLGKDRPVPNE